MAAADANPKGMIEWGGQSIRTLLFTEAYRLARSQSPKTDVTLINLRRKKGLPEKRQGFKNIDVVIVPEVLELLGYDFDGVPPTKSDTSIRFRINGTPNPDKNIFGKDGVQMGEVTLWATALLFPFLKTHRDAEKHGEVVFTVYGGLKEGKMARGKMLAPSMDDFRSLLPVFDVLGLEVKIHDFAYSHKFQGYLKLGVTESEGIKHHIDLLALVEDKGLRYHALDIVLQILLLLDSVGMIDTEITIKTDPDLSDHSLAIITRYENIVVNDSVIHYRKQ